MTLAGKVHRPKGAGILAGAATNALVGDFQGSGFLIADNRVHRARSNAGRVIALQAS